MKEPQSERKQRCRDVVEELLSYGIPADRLIPIMNDINYVLRMGDGLVWGQVADIIVDAYGEET